MKCINYELQAWIAVSRVKGGNTASLVVVWWPPCRRAEKKRAPKSAVNSKRRARALGINIRNSIGGPHTSVKSTTSILNPPPPPSSSSSYILTLHQRKRKLAPKGGPQGALSGFCNVAFVLLVCFTFSNTLLKWISQESNFFENLKLMYTVELATFQTYSVVYCLVNHFFFRDLRIWCIKS